MSYDRDREPQPIGAIIATAGLTAGHPISDWLRKIYADTQKRNRARAVRVRKYPDLVEALRDEADVRDPWKWNGYVPPEYVTIGEPETLRSPKGQAHPKLRKTPGEKWNDSPARTALQVIVDEADRRDREAGLDVDDPTSAEIVARHPFPFPGMRRGANYDDGIRAVEQAELGEPVPDSDYQHSASRSRRR